ncbi:MAG: hypothetical protein AAGF66_13130 [Cyanobacteria bacterium P01_H01_bin.119]
MLTFYRRLRRLQIISIALLLIAGCGQSVERSKSDTITDAPAAVTSTPSTSDRAPNREEPAASLDSDQPQSENADLTDTVPVVIYRINRACTDFVAEPARVMRDRALEQTLQRVLSEQIQAEFDLAGFRVSFDQETQVATIDLRLAPDSPRQFVSLSACEQMTLFGSLRETLLKNTQWDVESVEFTAQGKGL